MHLEDYRREFPVTESYVYLNHASVSPLPERTAHAMARFTEDAKQHGTAHYPDWMKAWAGVRTEAARLLGCDPGEIAITKNTSEGLAIVANGLDWRPADVVVAIRDEFPANYFPWLQLVGRGVKLRWLELQGGRIELDQIDRACRGARLLAISFVQYLSGFRVDLDALGEICRRHGTLLVVDGVQGFGALPVNVKKSGVHAFSASGHKWLLGPEGCGVLYVDRDLIQQVEPIEFGWTNVEGSRTYSHELKLRSDASRYECGTLNTIGCYGLRASLGLFLEAGVDQIAAQIDHLAGRIVAGVTAQGYEVMTARDGNCGSGIVTFRKEGMPSEDVVAKLNRNGVSTALRFGWIRAAPHFYINDEDVDRLLELLP